MVKGKKFIDCGYLDDAFMFKVSKECIVRGAL